MVDKKELAKDLLELGKFYFFNERYDEALRALQKSLKLDPENPEVYYNTGIVYEAKNDTVSAKEMYLRALELNPKLTLAQERLDKLVGK